VAIKVNGEVFHLPKPNRHNHVMHLYRERTKERVPAQAVQGFLTVSGRFVDRTVAAELALRQGQIPKLGWPPLLYSEDLW